MFCWMKPDHAYILTGGHSRRFGSPKCIAKIGERTMLEIVAGNLIGVFPNVYQVGKQAYGELPFIKDISDRQNPLTGIVTALRHCPDEWAFIMACDMPGVDAAVLNRLVEKLDDESQIVLPEVDGYLQYTCGFHHKSLSTLLEEKLAANDPALHRIVKTVNYKSVQFSDKEKFLNVNRVGDLV